MLKGAIFDMDGVLVDNMKIHMEAFAAIARRYGVPVNTYTVLGMAGKGNGEIFRQIFPANIIFASCSVRETNSGSGISKVKVVISISSS